MYKLYPSHTENQTELVIHNCPLATDGSDGLCLRDINDSGYSFS